MALIQDGKMRGEIAKRYGMPRGTFNDWLTRNPERSARARDAERAACHSYQEQALTSVREATDPFELAKAKEEAHHLRWLASKFDSKRFGEKVEHSGAMGIAVATSAAEMTNDQLAAIVAGAMRAQS